MLSLPLGDHGEPVADLERSTEEDTEPGEPVLRLT